MDLDEERSKSRELWRNLEEREADARNLAEVAAAHERNFLKRETDVMNLAEVTAAHAAKLEGFSSDLSSSPSWSDNIDFIS